ncbi:MAG: Stp1/IreP family PP2C-type Ser/Thr phosphatase [Ruminococcus sp.]|nr:Stp1/IreP family PP2C-type Ser/Thr phosphatase [Ruminococcus sp.]MCD7727574.1 Stp1/IreP family PP2C-type Ser/Thr phosphatase [Ruminococcus sp.]
MFITAKSDIGMVRSENQDHFKVSMIDQTAIAVVCDGMGGAVAGGEASEIASNVVYDRINLSFRPEMTQRNIQNLLVTALKTANTIVYDKSKSDKLKEGMGTTCVAAIAEDDIAYIASVGDSRAYLLDESGIVQITRDHTYIKMLQSQGKYDENDEKVAGMSHIITKAIGTEEDVDPDFFEVPLKEKSVLLLCSDGLTNYLTDEQIYDAVYLKPLETAMNEMINSCNDSGGKDNITIAIIVN